MANPVRRGRIGSRSLNKLLGATSGGLPANGAVQVEDLASVRHTKLTLTAVACALVDNAGVVAYTSKKIFDFPEGAIAIVGAVANLTLGKSSAGVNADWDGDFGLGTVAANNNNALATTEQNVIPTTSTPQAVAGATTAKGQSTGAATFDGTATAVDLYLNLLVDDADHDVTTTPCNLLVSGTIDIHWVKLGDY